MKLIRLLMALGFLTGTLTGCAGFLGAPVVPPPAFIYTSYKAPVDIDAQKTELGAKQGRAEVSNILGIVSTGDASVATAAKNGGVKVIRHLDYEFMSVLGLYSKTTVIVYGD